MKLSMKSDYAFRVLFTLVEHYGQGPVSIRELAERNDVPKAFLEHIMLELKARGWVASQAGKHGGYTLARSPDKISMGEIVRHFDGLDEKESSGRDGRRGKKSKGYEASRKFRQVMREAHLRAVEIMDEATLTSIWAGRPVTRAELLAQEFGGGSGI
jgi:Rrf2 family protein